MDFNFIKILVSFIKMFGYVVEFNTILDGAYGETNVWTRKIRIFNELVNKDKESLLMVLAHETGHMWHLEFDLEGTTKRPKVAWELSADLFCLEILSLANEIPSNFIREHMIDASLKLSMNDRRWASQTAKRGAEEFKKFLEKNS